MYWKDLHYWGMKISRNAVTHVYYCFLKQKTVGIIPGLMNSKAGSQMRCSCNSWITCITRFTRITCITKCFAQKKTAFCFVLPAYQIPIPTDLQSSLLVFSPNNKSRGSLGLITSVAFAAICNDMAERCEAVWGTPGVSWSFKLDKTSAAQRD